MGEGWAHRLDQAGRGLVPAVLAWALVLAGLVPLHLPAFGAVAPALALMAVYYWGIHRPDLFPAILSFAIGLLQDLLSGGPVGLNALIFVLTHRIVLSQRRHFVSTTFLMLWWGFAMVALGAAILSWFAVSALTFAVVPLRPLLLQAAVTVGLFPLLAWGFILIQRSLLQGV